MGYGKVNREFTMGHGKVNRREFLKLGFAGLSGAVLGLSAAKASAMMGGGMGMMGRGMGMMGGGMPYIIDPPPGVPFADPPVVGNLSRESRLVEVSLEARPAPVNIGGYTATLLTYNGSYPGPTIRVRRGDHLRIKFKNSLYMMGNNLLGHDRDISNLHTHGLHVSPSGNSDNMMVIVNSGDTFTYDYDLSKVPAGSLNFYHPHIHGTVAEQFWGGLGGALEVADLTDALARYETHVLFLKDIALFGDRPMPYGSLMDYMMGKEGGLVTVNGRLNPVLNIRPGQVQRWRVVNGSSARFYKLYLENHPLYVIGTDGGLLDRPYAMNALLLSPGERADILVKAGPNGGKVRLLSLPYNRSHGCMGGNQQVTLLTLDCRGSAASDEIPTGINPAAVRIYPPVVKTERMALSMGHGRGFINGITFEMLNKDGTPHSHHDMSGAQPKHHATGAMDDPMRAFTIRSKLGTYEIWEVFNHSMMDHPFHQHLNAAQVLAITGGDPDYAAFYTQVPALKDVVVVPKMGGIRILVPVMDFTGTAMFHCHIVEHEDIGMMGLWEIV
jgi:FtsP/CotA-like multicopper oxidase with cupredoxin domain